MQQVIEKDEINIDIDGLQAETQRMVLAIAAERNISPQEAIKLVLNYEASTLKPKQGRAA